MKNKNLAIYYIKNFIYFNNISYINSKASIFFINAKTKIFIDNIKMLRFLELIKNLLSKKYAKGDRFLFIGSENISNILKLYIPMIDCFYIDKKWAGGILTNFITTSMQIQKLKEINTTLSFNLIGKSKKYKNILKKKELKLTESFEGIKKMNNLPKVVLFLAEKKNSIIMEECFRLGIIPISILDLDQSPNFYPYFIYGNKNSNAYIEFFLKYILPIHNQ